MRTLRTLVLLGAALASPTSTALAAQPPSTATVYALTQRGNRLIRFQAGTPGTIEALVSVSGLQPGELLLGIDFRPSTGELQAVGSTSRLYTIDVATGFATPIGAAPFTPAVTSSVLEFGMDFNPVPDRVRVVSASDQNLRLHPVTGAVAGVDGTLAYAAGDANFGVNPTIVDVAYTNSFAGATSTTLFAIDSGTNALVRIGSPGGAPVSPNSGQITTVGPLGVDTRELTGFDISVHGGALAALSIPGNLTTTLCSIHLETGAVTQLGSIGGIQVRDLAIAPPSTPMARALTSDGRVVSFRLGTPGTLESSASISGLAAGEVLVGFDFRPSTGEVVALGSTSRLYRLDPVTGIAAAIGAPFSTLLSGTDFGFDFNPVPDRVRIVSGSGQNLRANPNTGALAATDTPLAFAAGDANAGMAPNVVASAYTDNFAGTRVTTLYGIDATLDVLVRQGSVDSVPQSPNGGLLSTIGALGLDAGPLCGFDIAPFGAAFASVTAVGGTSSQLCIVNLATGALTAVGTIGGGAAVVDIAIDPPFAPRAFAVTTMNELVSFAPGTPGTVTPPLSIGGLGAFEEVVGLEYRPATGQLLGLTSASRLVSIDGNSGLATVIGGAPFSTPLVGGSFGVDMNPTVDRVRIVSDAEQNLRANPNTGAIAGVDALLAFAAGDVNTGANPSIAGVAYTASFAGSFATTLFGIDTGLDVLVRQGSVNGAPVSPNSGALTTIGVLGMDVGGLAGFDVTTLGGAFVAVTPALGGATMFAQVDLVTGALTMVGPIATANPIRALTIP